MIMKKEEKEIKRDPDKQIVESVKSTIPQAFFPSGKLVAEIFGLIFIIALIWSVMGTNIWAMGGAGANLSVDIGWPWGFLTLSAEQGDGLPIDFVNLILDMLLYLVGAYIISVAVTVISSGFKKGPSVAVRSKKEEKIVENLRRVGEVDKL